MGKQSHESTVEARDTPTVGLCDTSAGKATEEAKGIFHRHRGIFHLHHHSKEEKEDKKDEEKKGHVSKREKVAAAIAGLGSAGKVLKKVVHPRRHGEGGGEEEGEGEEEEEEEEEEEGEDGGDGEEDGGFIEGLVSLISEAFEG